MNQQQSYQKKMEARFNHLAAQVNDLMRKVESRAQQELEKQAQTLPPKLKAAREKLEELTQASGEAWEDLKPGLEKAWTELQRAIEQAASRFRKSEKPGQQSH